jgi:hypothetical protein
MQKVMPEVGRNSAETLVRHHHFHQQVASRDESLHGGGVDFD